jgi:hypothetical protein
MAGMSVRRRLLRDAFLVLAVYLAIHAVAMCAEYGIGWDAHAYYVAWAGGLYEALPGRSTPTTTARCSPRSSGR